MILERTTSTSLCSLLGTHDYSKQVYRLCWRSIISGVTIIDTPRSWVLVRVALRNRLSAGTRCAMVTRGYGMLQIKWAWASELMIY